MTRYEDNSEIQIVTMVGWMVYSLGTKLNMLIRHPVGDVI